MLIGFLHKFAWAFFFPCFFLGGGGELGFFLSFMENCLQYFTYVWRRNYLTSSYFIFDTILLKKKKSSISI